MLIDFISSLNKAFIIIIIINNTGTHHSLFFVISAWKKVMSNSKQGEYKYERNIWQLINKGWFHDTGNVPVVRIVSEMESGAPENIQTLKGSYGSLKSRKVLAFCSGIFKDWKVLENE